MEHSPDLQLHPLFDCHPPQVNHLRMMLEDSHYKLAIAESKLASVGNEKEQEIDALKEKVIMYLTLELEWNISPNLA